MGPSRREVRVAFAPKFKRWFKRKATREKRKRCLEGAFRVADSIQKSPDGRPGYGNAKSLRGFEVPIYEFNLDDGDRVLYATIPEGRDIELEILDVATHDNVSRQASNAVDHLVHASRVDDMGWDDPEKHLSSFPLDFVIHNETGTLLDKNMWSELPDDARNDFREPKEGEREEEFEKWMSNERLFFTKDDLEAWTAKRLRETFSGASIYRLRFGPGGLDNLDNILETGELHPYLNLKGPQKELLEEDEQVFIIEGVAGTGKTTILELRFVRYLESMGWDVPVLFLTHNSNLAGEVRSRLKAHFPEDNHERLDELVIDTESWFRKMLELHGIDSRELFKPDRKIDYNVFSRILQKHERERKTDIAVLWEEYRGVMLGYALEELTESEYLALPPDHVLLDPRDRSATFAALKRFEGKLKSHGGNYSKEKGGWTDQDLARCLQRVLGNLERANESEGNAEFDLAADAYLSAGMKVDHYRCMGLSQEAKGYFGEASVSFEQAAKHCSKSQRKAYWSKCISMIDQAISDLQRKPEKFEIKVNDLERRAGGAEITEAKGNRPPCTNFGTENGCGYGPKCHFMHGTKEQIDYLKKAAKLRRKSEEVKKESHSKAETLRERKEEINEHLGSDLEPSLEPEPIQSLPKIGYDAIFVDEVQDLTSLQLLILLGLLEPGQGKFEAGGDTSQSVYPSMFRWEVLRRLVFEILKVRMDDHHRMDINYRSTPYLVRAANHVLAEHERVIGNQITHIQRAHAQNSGSHPSLIQVDEEQALGTLKSMGLPSAFCPLIVREEGRIPELRQELGDEDGRENVHVLSIPNSKGLEYENVILWDPFSGTNGLLDRFYHYKRGNAVTDNQAVALELRHLFVGITRARYRLAIIGNPDESSETEIHSGIAHLASNDELFSMQELDILTAFTKPDASVEDFLESAKTFEDRGRFELAADAYRSAGMRADELRCSALHHDSEGEFVKAGALFEQAAGLSESTTRDAMWGMAKGAIDSAIASIQDSQIPGSLMDTKSRICSFLGDVKGQADARAMYYEGLAGKGTDERSRKRDLRRAAAEYEKSGNPSEAVRVHKKAGSYLRAAKMALLDLDDDDEFLYCVMKHLSSKGHKQVLSWMHSGDQRWKPTVANALSKSKPAVKQDTLPSPNTNLELAIRNAEGSERTRLELRRAIDQGDHLTAAKKHEELGEFREAAEIFVKQGRRVDAIRVHLSDKVTGHHDMISDLISDIQGEGSDKEKNTLDAILERADLETALSTLAPKAIKDLVAGGDYLEGGFWLAKWIMDLYCPKPNGQHPLEFDDTRKFNEDILARLVASLFNNIHSNGKHTGLVMEALLNYLSFSSRFDGGSHWDTQEEVALKAAWYLKQSYLMAEKDLGSMTWNAKQVTDLMEAATKHEHPVFAFAMWKMMVLGNEKFARFKGPRNIMRKLAIQQATPILEGFGLTRDIFEREHYLHIQHALDHHSYSKDEWDEITAALLELGLNRDVLEKIEPKVALIHDPYSEFETEFPPAPDSMTEEMIRWANPSPSLPIGRESWLNRISDPEPPQPPKESPAPRPPPPDPVPEEDDAEDPFVPTLEGPKSQDEQLPSVTPEPDDSVEVDIGGIEEEPEEGEGTPLPFDEALAMLRAGADPYEAFIEASEETTAVSDDPLDAFMNLIRLGWSEDINGRWPRTDNDQERIVLVAAMQYLIDRTKAVDDFGVYQFSNSTINEHRNRAATIQVPLIGTKLFWSQRPWTN